MLLPFCWLFQKQHSSGSGSTQSFSLKWINHLKSFLLDVSFGLQSNGQSFGSFLEDRTGRNESFQGIKIEGTPILNLAMVKRLQVKKRLNRKIIKKFVKRFVKKFVKIFSKKFRQKTLTKKIRQQNSLKIFVKKIFKKNHQKKFVEKFVKEIVTVSKKYVGSPISVLRSSARPASGRRA